MQQLAIIYVLFAHFLGDYLFQDDVIATHKGKSIGWLILHALLYMFVLGLMMWMGAMFFDWTWKMAILFTLINTCTHFIIELLLCRINLQNWEDKKYHAFFIGFGFDQFLHISILIYTLHLFQS